MLPASHQSSFSTMYDNQRALRFEIYQGEGYVLCGPYAEPLAVEREMMFVKVQAEGPMRGEILRTVEIFRCKVVDVSSNEMTIEATGDHDKLEAIISLLQRFGIKELARTGSVAMRRSKKAD
jgi:acetolactate synthase-1/3 small subunit